MIPRTRRYLNRIKGTPRPKALAITVKMQMGAHRPSGRLAPCKVGVVETVSRNMRRRWNLWALVACRTVGRARRCTFAPGFRPATPPVHPASGGASEGDDLAGFRRLANQGGDVVRDLGEGVAAQVPQLGEVRSHPLFLVTPELSGSTLHRRSPDSRPGC